MRLTELNPRWVSAGGEGVTDKDGNAVSAREKIGVTFDCMCGCGERVYVPFANPIDGGPAHAPGRPLWNRAGETFDDLTTLPSIQRLTGCKWHGYITKGDVHR
jgi:hypothetical protein